MTHIDPWCNGNTADSGPAFPGSNPGGSTEKPTKDSRLFLLYSDLPIPIPRKDPPKANT